MDGPLVNCYQLLLLLLLLLSDNYTNFTLDSILTFSHHITSLTRSSYYQLQRRLRAICKSVSGPIFTSVVHALICAPPVYTPGALILGVGGRDPPDFWQGGRGVSGGCELLLHLIMHRKY